MQKVIIASEGPMFAGTLRREVETPDILWEHARVGYGVVKAAIGK